jgi:hypothetical protein
MQAIYVNGSEVSMAIPAFTTYLVNNISYYNLAAIDVPAGAVVEVALQEGNAHTAGSNVTLSTLSVDYNSGKTQLQSMLGSSSAPWKAILPTETGDALISLISTVHSSAQQNILRSLQDTFPATAVSDSAIYAGATMQGVRLNRKLPANMPVAITNNNAQQITIPPYTQFSGANTYWFNRDFITIDPGQTVSAFSLFQGMVKSMATNGLGTPYQAWASPEAGFTVSDTDTFVAVNSTSIAKLTTGLWTSKTGGGFVDKTLATGEFVVEFGDGAYGTMPLISDTVNFVYVVTSGSAANALNAMNKSITTTAYQNLLINALGNPSGGADETGALRYKNIAAYSFGTFGSAVNKSQLLTTILEYPGIADAVTFSEREVYQSNPKLMNYMQITYLLKSGVTWNSVDITNFIEYLHTNSLYSGRYNIVPPVASNVDVSVIVYCKSWANLDLGNSSATAAITGLFTAAGLNYDIMLTDISQAILASYSGIDYVDIVSPTKDAIVSTPWIPSPALAQHQTGILGPGSVTYSVGYISNTGATVAGKNLAYLVLPTGNSSVLLTWPAVASATRYLIYGRGGIGSTWGLIANVPATASNPLYIDDGRVVPVPTSNSSTSLPYNVVAYNKLGALSVKTYYTQRSGSAQG